MTDLPENKPDETTREYVEVSITVRIEEGGSSEFDIVAAGKSYDRIKDGDLIDAVTFIEDTIRRRVPWTRIEGGKA